MKSGEANKDQVFWTLSLGLWHHRVLSPETCFISVGLNKRIHQIHS